MSAAAEIQQQIDSLRERIELTSALAAMSLRVEQLESERRIEALEVATESMKKKLEAVERREQLIRKVEFQAACEGLPTTHPLAVRLAELRPTFAREGLLFPLPHFVSLARMVDELRLSDPDLFREPVIEEPHTDLIDEVRRDRWGDVPDAE